MSETITGEALLSLLGLGADNPEIQRLLLTIAHRVHPTLDPDDPDSVFDWIAVNEIGLEFGFADGAFLKALEPSQRHGAPPVLSQLYFYDETRNTKAFPYALPLGLDFSDTSAGVRHKLSDFEGTRRSYIRDSWRLPLFELTAAYRSDTNRLESVYCHLPFAPWPVSPDDTPLIQSLDDLMSLFGRRWSDPVLLHGLSRLNLEERIAEIRSEHEADFRRSYGLELMFTDGQRIMPASVPGLVFGAVTFYASRELDARQWRGPLPFGLSFDDSQHDVVQKVGEPPATLIDQRLAGYALWHFKTFSLRAMYSNVENRLLRVTVMAPGYH